MWLVEDGYECINENDDTFDVCYLKPKLNIKSISNSNIFTISFSQDMVIFDPINDSDISYYMTGPISKYKVSIYWEFIDSRTLRVQLITSSVLTGASSEYLHLVFNEDSFISEDGVTLYNNEVKGNTNPTTESQSLVEAAGKASDATITTSLVAIISSNALLGQSCELLWAFTNTIQIIYFMPLLSLYFPSSFSQFLKYLTSTKMKVNFISFSLRIPTISTWLEGTHGMPPLNNKYETMNYQSNAFMANEKDMIVTVLSGLATCLWVFWLKAILITLRVDGSPYQDMLDELEENEDKEDRQATSMNDEQNKNPTIQTKAAKMMRCKLF